MFILLYWVVDIPLFDNLDFSQLGDKAQTRLAVVGEENFIRICYAMLAIFCSSIILWITEAVQSYLTSLLVIMAVNLNDVAALVARGQGIVRVERKGSKAKPIDEADCRRAMEAIESAGLLTHEEQQGARKTLKAAAMTYVASALVAMANFLRLVLISRNRRR